jgi:hypothetical protein
MTHIRSNKSRFEEKAKEMSNVAMATLNRCIFGNQTHQIERVDSLWSNTFQITHVGLVVKDGMELLELMQGDGASSLAHNV